MYPMTSISENNSTSNSTILKNCLLCCKEFNEEKAPSRSPKLYEVCSKYLHSALTQDALASQSNDNDQHVPFCSKCFESAMQLVILSDQMDFIQKSVSDLVLMFSLEILHRRGKTKDVSEHDPKDNNSGKQLIEFDVSTLPSSDSWNNPTSFNDIKLRVPVASSSEFQEPISENLYTDQFTNPLSFSTDNNDTIENIKCESTDILNWIDESEDMLNKNTGLPTENEETLKSISTTHVDISKQTATVKLHRLKFHDSETKVVVLEGDADNFRKNKVQRRKIKKTILTKCDSGNSYKISDANEMAPSQKSSEQEPHPQQRRLSSRTLTLNQNVAAIPSASVFTENRLPMLLKCDVCNDTFKGRRQLILHKRNHNNELYYCEFCNKGFKQQGKMRDHRRLHTGEKPFMCSLCSKSFSNRYGLRYHHLTHHTKEKPFKCQACGKGFVQRWLLERHLIVHTGEGKYNCEQCQFTSAQHYLLKVHKIKKHSKSINAFKCRECEKDFKTSDSVELHYKTVHFALDFSDECIIKNS